MTIVLILGAVAFGCLFFFARRSISRWDAVELAHEKSSENEFSYFGLPPADDPEWVGEKDIYGYPSYRNGPVVLCTQWIWINGAEISVKHCKDRLSALWRKVRDIKTEESKEKAIRELETYRSHRSPFRS